MRKSLRFNTTATEINRRSFPLDGSLAIVTFETPYVGDRSECERSTEIKLPKRNGPYNRVQFHAWNGVDQREETAWYLASLREAKAREMGRETIQRQMQLCAPEPDGRQYAVTTGGMRIRVK